jgi:SAM-dependent methyltransferase
MSVALREGLFAALVGCARTFHRTATLWSYAAAGTARLVDLRAAIQLEWDQAGASQWNDHVAFGLMNWEREFYLRFLEPGERILLVGCGTGRELLALLELGYRAEGADVSPRCTAVARASLDQRGWKAPVHTGAIETLPVPGQFDAFILSWFCYSYTPESQTRIRMLQKLRAHLHPGGRILASYEPAEPLPPRLPIRLTQIVARLSGSDWHPEYGDVFRLADRGRHFAHYEHRFPPGAFEEEARAADLTVAFHQRQEVARVVLTPDGPAEVTR